MRRAKQRVKLLSSGISIKQKLIAIIMAVSSVALLTSSILIVLFLMESFRNHLVEEMSSKAKMIAYNCSAAVLFDDATDASLLLEALKEHPASVYAKVSRADQSTLASYRHEGFEDSPQQCPPSGQQRIGEEWLVALEPIIVDDRVIGSVFIQSDLREMFTFRNHAIMLIAAIFGAVLFVTLLLSSKLQQLISTPIEHLTRTTKRVTETRDYSLRALHTSNDEVGILTQAFNTMLSEIEQRSAALQQKDFVIHSSSTAIATSDLDGRLTYVNPAFLSAWEFDNAADVIGRHITDFWLVENRFDQIMKSLNGPGKKWSSEDIAKRRNGTLFDVQVSAATVLDGSGKPIGLMSTSTDISKRNQIAKDRDRLLHNTAKRVKELQCMHGVAESIRTKITLEEICADVAALIPNGWQHPTITRSRIRFDNQEYCAQPFEDSEWQQSAEIMVDNKSHGTIDVFYTEQRPEQDEGPFLKEERELLNGIARAMGEAVKYQQAEKERSRLLTAIEQAEEAVIITDTDATIQYASPAFERITGYTREEVIGKNPRFLNSGKQDAAFYKDMWDTLTRGETWNGQIINRKKDGTLYTEDATISPVHDASGKTINYIGVKHNITHEIELEAQLRQAQKMEAIGKLAGGIAHDFNNLLQVIMGYGEIALDDAGANNPAISSVEEMLKAGRRAKSLVDQMLAFSRQQVLKMQDVDLNNIIDDLMKMLPRVIGEHITLNVAATDDLGTIHGDPGQLEQILMNLCVNSRDAIAESGTITIETSNIQIDEDFQKTHSWSKPGPYVTLSVTDTGCGMDDDTLGKLFDPFFTTKEVGKGTGLGLSTVYGLVKQHQGGVHVYSELGKGTMIRIYLPRIERGIEHSDEKPKGPVPTGSETILMAEDDQSVRDLTRVILEEAGYTVFTANDGEEAVEVFKKHKDEIDMALLDVMMPKLGGKAAYEQICKIQPRTRILFASGYSMNALHTNFVLDDGLTLIQKPYHRDDLLRTVREVLNRA